MAKGDRRISFLLCSFCCSALCLNAQPPSGGAETNAPSSLTNRSDTTVKEISPGILQLGDVKINKRQRTVSFPAVVNLRHGAMEYLLVGSWGKVHESILRTETDPYRIHLAMLLLGAKGAGTNDEQMQSPAPFVSN